MRKHAPATERNRYPLLDVLRYHLINREGERHGKVLEIGAGTGQHARFFSENLHRFEWQPSDIDEESLASISAWREGGPSNLLEPIHLDVHDEEWACGAVDCIVAFNVIHISPWSATDALFRGAVRVSPYGPVILYGPFKKDGEHTAESNEQFERWLHSLDDSYGVRDLAAVEAVAVSHGYRLHKTVEMPANNYALVFVRS